MLKTNEGCLLSIIYIEQFVEHKSFYHVTRKIKTTGKRKKESYKDIKGKACSKENQESRGKKIIIDKNGFGHFNMKVLCVRIV
jgi:hypothetical protein